MIVLLRTSLLLFSTHLLRTVRSKRGLLCVVLASLPVALAYFVAHFAKGLGQAELATNLGWMVLLQLIVPLFGLIAGSAVVAEEIEDRTVTYLFSRPIPRAAVLIGRLLAASVFATVVLCAATLLLLHAAGGARGAGAGLDRAISIPLLLAVLSGALVYTALFATAGVFFKHPMIIGLGYTFAIEGFLANLPGKSQSLTIQYYLRSLIASGGSPEWRRVEGFTSMSFESAQHAWSVLALVLALALVLGGWRIARREFVLSA